MRACLKNFGDVNQLNFGHLEQMSPKIHIQNFNALGNLMLGTHLVLEMIPNLTIVNVNIGKSETSLGSKL